MKIGKITKNISILILIIVIFSNIASPLTFFHNINFPSRKNKIEGDSNNLKSAALPFDLIRDLELSTYYLSPENQDGENDGVFFTWQANQNGNYTIEIGNYPTFLTQTPEAEIYTEFCNPNGTDDWYVSYRTVNLENPTDQELRILVSNDKGQTWVEKTVASFIATGSQYTEYLGYLSYTAIAKDPLKGTLGVSTLENSTNLRYFRSSDEGATWSDSITILNVSEIGYDPKKIGFDNFPFYHLNFLKNGTAYTLIETNHALNNLSSIVYYKSNDNGTSWSGPHNITCLQDYNYTQPKLQVDYTSGNYWLMATLDKPGMDFDSIRFTNFSFFQGLNTDRELYTFGNNISGAYDFFIDEAPYRFNVVQNRYSGNSDYSLVYHLHKENETMTAQNESLGESKVLRQIRYKRNGFNTVYDGKNINFIYPHDYSGNNIYEINKYINYKNNTFWKEKGFFSANQITQTFWNGRINDTLPINTSLVKVDFTASNGTISHNIDRSVYLNIDNSAPKINEYSQKRNYFNPLSTNLSITEIPWELSSSEQCEAVLKISKENSSFSQWHGVTDNNWEDSNPKIFTSDTGLLYILYISKESGRNILYLTKSSDKGISWSNPVKVFESTEAIEQYSGTARGDIVSVLHRNRFTSEGYLYRSFDQGETFQPGLKLSFLIKSEARIRITQNYDIFMAFYNSHPSVKKYFVYRSPDLGQNWVLSKSWTIPDKIGKFDVRIYQTPDIIMDISTNTLHLVIPLINDTVNEALYRFATLDLTTNIWGPDIDKFHIIDFENDFTEFHNPRFLISKSSTSQNIVRAIFIHDFVGDFEPEYKEIITKNAGVSWDGPSMRTSLNRSSFTSFEGRVYLAKKISDGYDYEIAIKRNTTLIRLQENEIEPSTEIEILYDGLDDFGNYIPEGNYSYTLMLRDNAGNKVREYGWLYADYKNPQIFGKSLNTSNPRPAYDVNVSLKISELTDFSAKLYYRKDSQNWQSLDMESVNNEDLYSAVIPGETNVKQINYFIKCVDSAGNINETQQWSYSDYNAPLITDLTYNWSFTPTPLHNVNISVRIIDETDFLPVLFYSKDGNMWNTINMISDRQDFYYAIITKDATVEEIRYYIRATDFAGNTYELDNGGLYYKYNIPEIDMVPIKVFEEEERYSSGENYEISIKITHDLEYVRKVTFKYSYDGGTTWKGLELKQQSPEFTGKLKNIPEDLRNLKYHIIVEDIFGNESTLIDTQTIEFYPELPDIRLEQNFLVLLTIISAILGFAVAFIYIKLKRSSHNRLSRDIVLNEFKKQLDQSNEENQSESENAITFRKKKKDIEEKDHGKEGSYPFLIAYITILCINLVVFFAGLLLSQISVEMGVLLMGASLLISVLGYMFLMNRDITTDIYMEKVVFKNIALETFQIIFMGINLIMILLIGFSIGWFRYYLLEQTFDFGAFQVPRAYISVIGVFFTSLVLVGISTLFKLNRTVKKIKTQREKGASDMVLLYVKDQEASRIITRLGLKTVVFLATVLATLVMTTDILNLETGFLLALVLIPFIISSMFALLVNRLSEKIKIRTEEDNIERTFMDSLKYCNNCNQKVFLSSKFCPECGEKLVFENKIGKYIIRCANCNSLIHEDAEYCPSCGTNVQKISN